MGVRVAQARPCCGGSGLVERDEDHGCEIAVSISAEPTLRGTDHVSSHCMATDKSENLGRHGY
jgi:hypothetical protein